MSLKKIERSALVHFTPAQMFALVNDIETYPQFMRNCADAKILQRGDDWLEARLTLSKAGVIQSFVTRNQLHAPDLIHMQLVEGPFSQLEGYWRFTAITADSCKVSLTLSFDLPNPIMGFALGKLFESVANEQVDAFCQRAKQIYV